MMTGSPTNKWDLRYQHAQQPNQPAQVITDNIHLLPSQGHALELACGLGGNALLLAAQGLTVEAWDSSAVAIAKLGSFANHNPSVDPRCIDLDQQQPAAASYDVICVSAYLDRNICPHIEAALKPGGLLFYQTFTLERVLESGPTNPAFLLQPGELMQLFRGLDTLAYREESRCGNLQLGLRNQAYLVARKP
ncbi:MAG: methyltransferase domain-containing protein [Motiliproteus sp.]